MDPSYDSSNTCTSKEMSARNPVPYSSLPPKMKKELSLEEPMESSERFVKSFLEARVKQRELQGGLMKKLQVQTLLMSRSYKPPKVTSAEQPPRKLNAKQKRSMKLYEIPTKQQRFENFLPLHELWVNYMEDLLLIEQGRSVNQTQRNQKVLKADYHGCLLSVVRSRCPSYVGTEGIVVQETQNTMKLVCRDNKIRTIPKAHSIFTFELGGFQYSLYGNHMRFRASERSAKKFKDKPTIDL